MTDSEKLNLIISEMKEIKQDVTEIKQEVSLVKQDVDQVKQDVDQVKQDVDQVKQNVSRIDRRITSVELHLENGTDKNIQLIAENFIELTKKLNQAIPVADKNLAYEVKVNYLIEKVQLLEKEVQELKSKTA
ncbi:MAG: hypothetical protein HFH15_00005 [Ruminococcus sp.]|jgi:chromosome segregation ATPase|nr:hypothetical protein [Ruminococcus sp.]